MDKLVQVKPRLRPYEPYAFWLLGAPTSGFECSGRAVDPEDRLAVAWLHMMNRCYNKHSELAFSLYGAKGVSVCKRWHQVKTYVSDVQKLHGWQAKLADWSGYDLDKDYYSSNVYSPETCIWISKFENTSLKGKPVLATSPFGLQEEYESAEACSRGTGMAATQVRRAADAGLPNRKGTHAGWKVEYIQSEHPLRRPLGGL